MSRPTLEEIRDRLMPDFYKLTEEVYKHVVLGREALSCAGTGIGDKDVVMVLAAGESIPAQLKEMVDGLVARTAERLENVTVDRQEGPRA